MVVCPLDGRLLACLVLRPGRAHTVKHTGTDITVSRAVEAREGKEGYIGYIGGGLSWKRKGREDGDGSGRIRVAIGDRISMMLVPTMASRDPRRLQSGVPGKNFHVNHRPHAT